MSINVFISYKYQDIERNQWVERFYKDLRLAGIDAKLDKYEVAPGESFSDYMTRGIRESDFVLFIVTPKSVESVESGDGALAFEMQISNARRLAAKDPFRIIPIFREGNESSTYLSDHRYLDFRNNDEYDFNLRQLISWLAGEIKPPPLGDFSSIITKENIASIMANTGLKLVHRSNKYFPEWDTDLWLENKSFLSSISYYLFRDYKDYFMDCDIFPLSTNAANYVSEYVLNFKSLGGKVYFQGTNYSILNKFSLSSLSPERPSLLFDLVYQNNNDSINDIYQTIRSEIAHPKAKLFTMLNNDLHPDTIPSWSNIGFSAKNMITYCNASDLINFIDDSFTRNTLQNSLTSKQ